MQSSNENQCENQWFWNSAAPQSHLRWSEVSQHPDYTPNQLWQKLGGRTWYQGPQVLPSIWKDAGVSRWLPRGWGRGYYPPPENACKIEPQWQMWGRREGISREFRKDHSRMAPSLWAALPTLTTALIKLAAFFFHHARAWCSQV